MCSVVYVGCCAWWAIFYMLCDVCCNLYYVLFILCHMCVCLVLFSLFGVMCDMCYFVWCLMFDNITSSNRTVLLLLLLLLLLLRNSCTILVLCLKSEIMDGFLSSWCLTERMYLPDKIGSFLSGATTPLVVKMVLMAAIFKCPYLCHLKSYSAEIQNLS